MESFSGGRMPTSVSTKKRFFIQEAVTDSEDEEEESRRLVVSSVLFERSGSHLDA